MRKNIYITDKTHVQLLDIAALNDLTRAGKPALSQAVAHAAKYCHVHTVKNRLWNGPKEAAK